MGCPASLGRVPTSSGATSLSLRALPTCFEQHSLAVPVSLSDIATWAALVGTWILVVGTLAFAYWQTRQARRINSAQTILDLRGRFDAPAMRAARRQLAAELLAEDATKEVENFDVYLFFQLVGSLTHEGILDRRMVWNAFTNWITSYYHYLTHPVNRIAQWRADAHDPSILREFEWLAKEMIKLDHQMVRDPIGAETTHDDAQEMMGWESQLAERN